MKRWIGCLGLAALLAAGCGGDDAAEGTGGDQNTDAAASSDNTDVTQVVYSVPGMT